DQPLQVGHPSGLAGLLLVGLEEDRQPLEEGRLPEGEEAGADLVLATHLGLGGGAGEDVEYDLRLELGREGPSGASGHRSRSEGARGSLSPWPHFRGALQTPPSACRTRARASA